LFEEAGKGKQIGQLSKDVRVAETDLRGPNSPSFWVNVVAVDGQLAGKRGWIPGTMVKSDEAKTKARGK
jgi:hypothetical protein